jgi:ketol-acid reductoisomerase
MYQDGLHGMRERISRTAAWGSFESGPRIVTEQTRRALAEILEDVASGRFARRWLEEARKGSKELDARMRAEEAHDVERAGRAVRDLVQGSKPNSTKEST